MSTTSRQIGIFPAAGGIGGSTVQHLLSRHPPKNLTLIARHPQKLEHASSQGATVRRADYDDDQSLQTAFEGVDTLFLISYASVQHHHRSERQKAAIDSAISSGVKYIFYASLGYAGSTQPKTSRSFVMQSHLDTEKYLESCAREKGIGYTVVRQGLYTEGYPLHLSFFDIRNPVDEIRIPTDGEGEGIAWVKQDELGEGNAEMLKRFVVEGERSGFVNQTVLFSGPKALSYAETAAILGKIAGRDVKIRKISREGWASHQQIKDALTYDKVDYALVMASTFEATRHGETGVVDPLLGELLGREPEGFETTVSRMVEERTEGPSFWDRK